MRARCKHLRTSSLAWVLESLLESVLESKFFVCEKQPQVKTVKGAIPRLLGISPSLESTPKMQRRPLLGIAETTTTTRRRPLRRKCFAHTTEVHVSDSVTFPSASPNPAEQVKKVLCKTNNCRHPSCSN